MCLSFFYGPLMRHFITLILAVFALEAGVFSQDNVGFAGLPFVIQLIILLLLQDLLIFVRHRVFDGKNLWRFHSIHHSSTEVNWLSSYRFHPVESLIEAALNIILFMLIGPSQDVLIVAALIIGFNNLFIHSDCPFAARFCKPGISPLAPLQRARCDRQKFRCSILVLRQNLRDLLHAAGATPATRESTRARERFRRRCGGNWCIPL